MNVQTLLGWSARVTVVALLGQAICIAEAQEPDVVRISIYQPRGLGCAALLIAEQQGYFEQEGIAFEPLYVKSGPQVVQHMAADELDIGCGAITVWMIGKTKGVETTVIFSTAKGNAPLVVQPQIETIAELDGKRCGTPGLGTIHDDNLRAFEQEHDIEVEHVHASGGMSALVAMFETGEIDCMTGWEPLMAAATVKSGAKYLVDFIRPKAMESVEYAVMSQFAEAEPDVVYRFVRALLKGSTFLEEKRGEAIRILANLVGLEPEIIERALEHTIATEPYVDLNGAQVALEDAVAAGKIPAAEVGDPPSFVRGMVDHSYLERAEEALQAEEWKP